MEINEMAQRGFSLWASELTRDVGETNLWSEWRLKKTLSQCAIKNSWELKRYACSALEKGHVGALCVYVCMGYTFALYWKRKFCTLKFVFRRHPDSLFPKYTRKALVWIIPREEDVVKNVLHLHLQNPSTKIWTVTFKPANKISLSKVFSG